MGYKVEFENNAPKKAVPADKDYTINSITQSPDSDDDPVIKTLYIEASNADDAMRVATKVVNAILGSLPSTMKGATGSIAFV